MSKSTHQLEIRGADKTGGAFSSIKSRASAAGAQIRSMVGGALAAAGTYLGLKSIVGGINELGKLSDIAQRTNTSVDDLTKTTAAFGALGVNIGVEQFAKSMDYLAKTSGRTGMAGFYQTIAEIGKVPDVAKRGELAMKYFGRSGMELMPLINSADQSVEALETVVAAMPSIPQSAADAGDAVADAMGFAAQQAKSIWLQGLGTICGWFDNEYAGGIREASLAAGNYVEYFVKSAMAKVITWFRKTQEYLKRFGDSIGSFVGAMSAGASIGEAWDMAGSAWDQAVREYDDVAAELDKKEAERTERFKRNFEQRAIEIKKFQSAYNSAASSVSDRQKRLDEATVTSKKISNDLILGGSNAVSKLQIFGPSYQSESKKQTALLEKIADNTEKTADNTETAAAEEMGVVE